MKTVNEELIMKAVKEITWSRYSKVDAYAQEDQARVGSILQRLVDRLQPTKKPTRIL